MTERLHEMPFGAVPLPGGGFRFGLWAPACQNVVLDLDGSRYRMVRGNQGWFGLDVTDARAGSRYFFDIGEGRAVPDPASRFQPDDVNGASALVDPRAHQWQDDSWHGRPWEEAVIYELHVGAFTEEGTFDAAVQRLDHLAALGVTAIEIMPVADWPGRRNWGYDGVALFAPDAALGGPDAFKRLIEAAHARGLMVLLDVVYNHFGPEGNYLGLLAPQFFTERMHTPWGAAIDFEARRQVRDFYIHNALYWLEEFNLDGLRFDAVHAIYDRSSPDILTELARTLRARITGRPVHLVLENERREARYVARDTAGRPKLYTAHWNDPVHHALHVAATGESSGYYASFVGDVLGALGRALTASPAPGASVNFLQNHDQIGNRAMGDRLTALAAPEAVEAGLAIILLSPQVPLLFMGEEWGTRRPFTFFCDFHDELADRVRDGRRAEFAAFPEFADPAARARIPDPNAEETFRAAQLDWRELEQPACALRLAYVSELLRLRRQYVAPLAARITASGFRQRDRTIVVEWLVGADVVLRLTVEISRRWRVLWEAGHNAPIFSYG